jgi:ABC-2 type transport system permease protein
MIEKELRYLARAPRFRLLFLMGCALGIVIPRAIYRNDPPLWAPGYLTAAAAYSLLILGEPCFWNIFGFDRSAAQMYFLTPVKFTRVLVAKNVTAALWLSVQLIVMWGLARALQSPVGLAGLGEAASVLVVTALLLWSAGNYVSVRNARPTDPDSSMRSKASGGLQFLLVFAYPLTLTPAGLAYFARWAFGAQWVFYAVIGVMAALAAMVYSVALESTAEYAVQEKEAMVTALSARQGPIAS